VYIAPPGVSHQQIALFPFLLSAFSASLARRKANLAEIILQAGAEKEEKERGKARGKSITKSHSPCLHAGLFIIL
jgi:hypothetical protein